MGWEGIPLTATHAHTPESDANKATSDVSGARTCTYEDFLTKKMAMLPNCPQSSTECVMFGGKTCTPTPKCDGCPKDAMFLGSETFDHKESCSKQRTSTTYNYYRLQTGAECFTQR